jgi:xanthine dehydrogenase accessory factor
MPADAELILEQVTSWRDQGLGVAVCTVVRTWGSSPRPAGSQLAVNERGEFVGSVSGGCIEGAVITAAQGVLADPAHAPRLLDFGVTHDMAWEVGLACGGQVQVFVEAAKPEVVAALRAALSARQDVVLVTALASGAQQLVAGDGGDRADGTPRGGAELSPEVRDAVSAAARRDQAVTIDTPEGALFLQPFCAPVRLVLIGAVHIAQPLAKMAALCGLEVTVVDPRTAFSTEARFPGVTLMPIWPGPALAGLGVDRRTAIVTLTHDPKLDDPALEAALRSECFYVGSLGSGKTHAARLNRLRGRGFSDADVARIRGPVGLAIGARSPAEIAASILAQVIEELRREALRREAP